MNSCNSCREQNIIIASFINNLQTLFMSNNYIIITTFKVLRLHTFAEIGPHVYNTGFVLLYYFLYYRASGRRNKILPKGMEVLYLYTLHLYTYTRHCVQQPSCAGGGAVPAADHLRYEIVLNELYPTRYLSIMRGEQPIFYNYITF